MPRREIPEIDEAAELLEQIEHAEKARRLAERTMAEAHSDYKEARKAYEAACQECFRVTGQRLDTPLFNQEKDDEENEEG